MKIPRERAGMPVGVGCDRRSDILIWCTENRCGKYPHECCGVNHPALCPEIEPDEPGYYPGQSIRNLRCSIESAKRNETGIEHVILMRLRAIADRKP